MGAMLRHLPKYSLKRLSLGGVVDKLDVLSKKQFSKDKMQKLNLIETQHLFCDIYCLLPGQSQKVHSHKDADKIYFVLEGTTIVQIGEEERTLERGEIVLAPAGLPHGVRNDSQGEVTLLVMMAPNPNQPG